MFYCRGLLCKIHYISCSLFTYYCTEIILFVILYIIAIVFVHKKNQIQKNE